MKENMPSTTTTTKNIKEEPLVPPIQPFSPQEIYKFTALDLALRSHPELAREGATLLNPRALAKLVHGIKSFQDANLGRRSKYTASKSWPITKLPDPIFRSRSANGPLFSLLITAYKVKKRQNWKAFDFTSMNRYDDNILLLTEIEKSLINDGWLVRPVCYFDTTVDKEKVEEYSKIIARYGGVVVDEFNGMLEGGQSIASLKGNANADSKEINGSSRKNNENEAMNDDNANLGNPKRKKRKKNAKSPKRKAEQKQQSQPQPEQEQKQIVTHVIAWDDEEHDSETTLQHEEESAYAHNFDIVEKSYLRTLSVIDPKKQNSNNSNIVETNMLETKKKGGRLGGKGKKGKAPNDPNNPMLDGVTPMAFVHWWYLPSSYDEFMLASDVSGDNDSPQKPDGGPWVVGCKFIRDIEKYNEWGVEEDYAIVDYEKKVTLYKELAKKKMEEAKLEQEKDEQAKKLKARKSSKSPTLRLRLTTSNKSTAGDQLKQKETKIGMNPRQIFTGYYDNRTKIKRVVYDGALKVPKEVSSLIRQSMAIAGVSKQDEQKNYLLPKVGMVLRPSEDIHLLSKVDNGTNGFIVTELRCNSSGTTLISNRRCVAIDLLQTQMPSINTGTLARIRGGGDNETKNKENNADTEVVPMDTSEDGKAEVMDTTEDNQKSEETQSKEETSPDHSEDARVDVRIKLGSDQQNSGIVIEETAIIQDVPKPESESNSATASTTNKERTNIIHQAAATTEHPVKVESLIDEGESEKIKDSNKSDEAEPKVEPTNVNKDDEVKTKVEPTNVNKDDEVKTKVEPTNVNKEDEMKTKAEPAKTNEAHVDPSIVTSSGAKVQTSQLSQALKATIDPPSNLCTFEETDAKSMTQQTSGIKDDSKQKDINAEDNKAEKNDENNEEKKEKSNSSSVPQIMALKSKDKTSKDAKDSKILSGDQEMTCELPPWYDCSKVSSLEKTLLPEWFDQSSNHRTLQTFITTRERMIEVARNTPNKYITSTAIRRCVPGDAGSLMRMHQFLVSWGFINGSAIGDSAPTVLMNDNAKKTTSRKINYQTKWTSNMVNLLTVAVSSFATKKRKRDEQEDNEVSIDWDIVAGKVGENITPQDCYHKFMSLTFDNLTPEVLNRMDKGIEIDDVTAVTIDNESKQDREQVIAELVNGVRPAVAQAAINASLQASGGNLVETQRASVLASLAHTAAQAAKNEEDATDRILQEILDQRMSKLENRLSLLDDLECMFDAERMALELERRDLYTLRCRHWFAGDS